MVYFWIRLLNLINLLCLKEFFLYKSNLTTSESNNRIKWVEKWYLCYWVQCEALVSKWKGISNILFRKHYHERGAELFLNFEKANKVWKSLGLLRSHDTIPWGCGKKLRRFRIIFHIRCLQTEHLRRRIVALRRIQ